MTTTSYRSPSTLSFKPPVATARERQGLSRRQLAVLAGTTVGTIEQLEAGAKPDPLLLETLAGALNTAAIDLAR